MKFEWNEEKAAANLAKHRIAFDAIERFETATAIVEIDNRRDYGETRFVAMGLLDGRVVVVVYTERGEDIVRVISIRPAGRQEVIDYVESF